MTRKFATFLALSTLCFILIAPIPFTTATTVFSDDFSNSNLSAWTATSTSSGSQQAVNGGVARFIVNAPAAGTSSFSFVRKDGFISTANSIITASEDIYVTNVPNGCQLGNGAVFFLYICDSADLGGNRGNLGVGIDGSGLWSLWIGGNLTYTYVFQSIGAAPVSNTWYHVVLTADNPSGTALVTVNGATVISATQKQFTDQTHPITLMVGMGEDWWSTGPAQQEIDIDNVSLDISDASIPTSNTVNPIATPPQSADPPTTFPTNDPTLPTQNQTTEPAPTQASTPQSKPNPTLPTPNLPTKPSDFPYWIALPMGLATAMFLVWVLRLKKRFDAG